MQLIKIVLHGFLKDRYQSFAVGASTPAEAIEGWSRQAGLGDLPIGKRPLVQVLNHDKSLFQKTSDTEIHLVPAMFGGGAVARIAIGAVMVVAGAILTFSGMPQFGIPLIMSGAGMMIGGVMQLFNKTPKVGKSEDPDPSKYIGSGKNTTAIGTLMGMGGGRMRIGGQFLSVQVDSSDMIHGVFPSTPT